VTPPHTNRLDHTRQRASSSTTADPNAALKLKKAWEVATAPGKSIPMNGFMLWMAGNGVQIFSIMITGMLLFNAIKSLFAVQSTFQPFESTTETSKRSAKSVSTQPSPLMMPKLTFIALQLALLLMGVWKCQGMGLLPTAESDWLAFMTAPRFREMLLS
jgi:hypothetical protein